MKMNTNRILIYIGAIVICFIMFFPFIWGFVLSFKDNNSIYNAPFSLPSKFDFSLYIDTFLKSNLGILFINSLIVTTITTIGAILICIPSSYAIARLHHKHPEFGNFFYYLFIMGAAVPLFIILYPVYTLALKLAPLGMGTDSIFGLPLPYITGGIPFNTLVLVGAMKGVPLEMEEAGIMDGGNLWTLITKIMMPLIGPTIATLIIFNFLWAWNEWTLASILLSSIKKFTVPLAASFFQQQYGQDLPAVLRAVIMLLIPQMIFYLIFQKRIVQGLSSTGLKG